jgi:predicted secreted hydrolase
LLVLSLAVTAGEWRVAVPDYRWAFPRDHWAHDGYRTEWWYLTGHLQSESDAGRRFGYQFTMFRIGVVNEPVELDSDWASSSVVMGHAAITDLKSGTHVFAETLYREMPLLAAFSAYPEPRIGWSRGPAGTEELWTLAWNGNGFDVAAVDTRQGMSFRLETTADKPLVFQGPNGFSRKGADRGAASQYYSFTRLATRGELELGGERFRVHGESWMDKEFSSSHLGKDQVGWDWFSLQLDDGRELMLYLMRRADGSIDYASGTLIDEEGTAELLRRGDFDVDVMDGWTSPSTGARYPSRWRIRLLEGELDFEVRALVADQENRSRLPGQVYYWEGAVEVSGGATGRGFVELAGYGEGNRPPV